MADLSTLLQLGGMGVMAFTVIAVVRAAGPILTALSDRLLDSLERQTQAIDRLGEVAASMDKRLVVVEQQIDMLQDLIHGVIWPQKEITPRPSSRRKPSGGILIPASEERQANSRGRGE
ncbi:hypothetical protein K2Z83_13470 [Oscillochloris sp. ZM17-4]|uniref:hypothetical protein n=1 Tax=Oscillochloris sp. ZM17-4 TaxID=2866714 RepID=UPI001C73CEC3|nr:hypothetical protein [Oscillochloris sp. ZM17-4]MBX0328686.1 hypothetical protein [Oscillochloris sp. ZM17-4]